MGQETNVQNTPDTGMPAPVPPPMRPPADTPYTGLHVAKPRHDPLTLIAVGLSAAALIVSLASVGVSLNTRRSMDAPATATSSRSGIAGKTTPKTTVKTTPTERKAVEWALQDGGTIEGDGTYDNVHYKVTKCTVKGNTATITVEAANNDTDNQSVSLMFDAYQNGVQVSEAYASSGNSSATIQPGVTVELTESFTLSDPTKPVTFEMDYFLGQKISATFAPKN